MLEKKGQIKMQTCLKWFWFDVRSRCVNCLTKNTTVIGGGGEVVVRRGCTHYGSFKTIKILQLLTEDIY